MGQLDYRDIKKLLNRYHRFSFSMPRKGQPFKPQQKSAITRKFNEYQTLIKRVLKNDGTFIPYPKGTKLPDVDGLRTNKGIFYKYPGAKPKKLPGNKWTIEVDYKKMREVFLPFPEDVKYDLELMRLWVEGMANRHKPDYITWSVNGFKGRTKYEPDVFSLYAQQMPDEYKDIEEALTDKPFYNGVFFGLYPDNPRSFVVRIKGKKRGKKKAKTGGRS